MPFDTSLKIFSLDCRESQILLFVKRSSFSTILLMQLNDNITIYLKTERQESLAQMLRQIFVYFYGRPNKFKQCQTKLQTISLND